MNMAKKLQVPEKVQNFLTSYATITFSKEMCSTETVIYEWRNSHYGYSYSRETGHGHTSTWYSFSELL
jgi:hypothetical protein